MHEIRATVVPEQTDETVRLAREAGIDRINVADVYVHGPDARRRVVSVETSTPKARAFVEAVLSSPTLAASDISLTSRELRAIINDGEVAELTRPMSEPFPDVIQDLWQLSHVSPSYLGRAFAGAILMAAGLMDNNPIAIVVAALFLPFLAEVLSVTFGVWSKDMALLRRGLMALVVSTILAYAGGAAVAWLNGGPVLFHDFKGPLPSFGLSAVIGITAGLSNADDTGRRYLIGVAAAVQLAVFPVWLGASTVAGLQEEGVVKHHLMSFLINLVTISVTALLAYAALHLHVGGGFWRAPRRHRSAQASSKSDAFSA
jgi:hypothetical protein